MITGYRNIKQDKIIAAFIFLSLISTLNSFAQSKAIYFTSKYQKLAARESDFEDDAYYIKKDTLAYRSGSISLLYCVLLFNPELTGKLSFSNCTYSFKSNVTIDSSTFVNDDEFPFPNTCNGNDVGLNLEEGFSVTNSTFSNDLAISNVTYSTQSGAADVNYNRCNNLDLSYNKCRLFNVMQNVVEGQFSFSWTQSDVTILGNNHMRDPSKSFAVDYSNFRISLQSLNNNCNKLQLNEDTVAGILNIVFTTTNDESGHRIKKEINISNSQINSKCFTDINDSLFESKIIFDNCSFGSSASLFNLKVDTIIIKNCTNIPYPLFLTADTSKKRIYIQLTNSNVNNIRFDYTDKFKLFFDKDVSEETKNNTYQSLFAKYKAEGKPANIEKIDIEYKRYEYKKNWLMYPIWFLDYVWWRYGYSKWLIILWSLIFLGIFFSYNFKNWEGMRKMYGVFDKDDLSILDHEKNPFRLRKKMIYVMLFTSFIFFSLRVDFDKLKYANNKFLISFFTQYIVGLICLFFLANAIFKLG